MYNFKNEIKQFAKYSLFGNLHEKIKLNRFRRIWYQRTHNPEAVPMNIFPIDCVSIGCCSYGELNVVTFGEKSKLHIGNYVSIAQNVTFLLDVEHCTNHISTFTF